MTDGCKGVGKRNGRRLFFKVGGAVACVLCLILSGSEVLAAGEDNWTVGIVALNANIDYDRISMALDGNGNPAMVYQTKTVGTNFSYLDGGTWKHELVDASVTSAGFDLVWDGSTWLVAYGNGALKFAKRDPSTKSWTIKTLERSNVMDGQKGICVYNANGQYKIGISYAKSGLKYAEYVGGAWTTTLVDGNSNGGFSSMKFDSAGNPVMAYYDHPKVGKGYSPFVLKYAKRTSGTWSLSTIASGTDDWYGVEPTLVLDSNGNPYIVDQGAFYYNTGSGWTVDHVTPYLFHTSIVLDETGGTVAPIISYSNSNTCTITISKKVDGAWVSESVTPSTGWETELQFFCQKDANNNIVVKKLDLCYMRLNPASIYYAERDLLNPSTWG